MRNFSNVEARAIVTGAYPAKRYPYSAWDAGGMLYLISRPAQRGGAWVATTHPDHETHGTRPGFARRNRVQATTLAGLAAKLDAQSAIWRNVSRYACEPDTLRAVADTATASKGDAPYAAGLIYAHPAIAWC